MRVKDTLIDALAEAINSLTGRALADIPDPLYDVGEVLAYCKTTDWPAPRTLIILEIHPTFVPYGTAGIEYTVLMEGLVYTGVKESVLDQWESLSTTTDSSTL